MASTTIAATGNLPECTAEAASRPRDEQTPMSIGRLGRVPAARRSRFKGAQGRAGVAAPDAALAQKPVGSVRAEVGHLRQHTAEAGAAPPPGGASQGPEWGVHSAFDHAAIGMALVAPGGRWLKVNRALCGIVGYSEPEMLGLTYQAITHPDDLAIISAHATKLLAGEIATYEAEKRYVHKKGHNVPIFLSMSLVRDGNGASSATCLRNSSQPAR